MEDEEPLSQDIGAGSNDIQALSSSPAQTVSASSPALSVSASSPAQSVSASSPLSSSDSDLPSFVLTPSTSASKTTFQRGDLAWAKFRDVWWPSVVKHVYRARRCATVLWTDECDGGENKNLNNKGFKVSLSAMRPWSYSNRRTFMIEGEKRHGRRFENAVGVLDNFLKRRASGDINADIFTYLAKVRVSLYALYEYDQRDDEENNNNIGDDNHRIDGTSDVNDSEGDGRRDLSLPSPDIKSLGSQSIASSTLIGFSEPVLKIEDVANCSSSGRRSRRNLMRTYDESVEDPNEAPTKVTEIASSSSVCKEGAVHSVDADEGKRKPRASKMKHFCCGRRRKRRPLSLIEEEIVASAGPGQSDARVLKKKRRLTPLSVSPVSGTGNDVHDQGRSGELLSTQEITNLSTLKNSKGASLLGDPLGGLASESTSPEVDGAVASLDGAVNSQMMSPNDIRIRRLLRFLASDACFQRLRAIHEDRIKSCLKVLYLNRRDSLKSARLNPFGPFRRDADLDDLLKVLKTSMKSIFGKETLSAEDLRYLLDVWLPEALAFGLEQSEGKSFNEALTENKSHPDVFFMAFTRFYPYVQCISRSSRTRPLKLDPCFYRSLTTVFSNFVKKEISPSISSPAIINSKQRQPRSRHLRRLSSDKFDDDDEDPDALPPNSFDNAIDNDFGVDRVDEFLTRSTNSESSGPSIRNHHGPPIVHHHGLVCELPPNHRFVMGKFDGCFNYLMMDGVVKEKQIVHPSPVPASICGLIHDPDYIRAFFTGLTSEKDQRKTGFKWSPGLVRRCRIETSATILACRLAMETGMACSTGGGTHHAFPDHGSGYCLINDIAIAAKFAIHSQLAEKVLVVDLDVHQGDGTAFAFSHDPSVFTLSVHAAKNFPLRKQKSDLDLALDDHVADREYLGILSDTLPGVLDSFRPDLVIYDAGVDPHVDDDLGRLNLTDQGLFDRDRYVINQVFNRGIPVGTVIGGGYSRWWDDVSLRHTIVHRAATDVWRTQ